MEANIHRFVQIYQRNLKRVFFNILTFYTNGGIMISLPTAAAEFGTMFPLKVENKRTNPSFPFLELCFR